MTKYEFTHNADGENFVVTVLVHDTFAACFKEYCDAAYFEEKVGRGEPNRQSYEKMFIERGRWAWFQRGKDNAPIIHLCILENEHMCGSVRGIVQSLAHELDHFWKSGFFTSAESEASAVLTGYMADHALDMALDIVTDRYAKTLVQEICAGVPEEHLADMDTIFECMKIVHEMGISAVNSGEWTHDGLDDRMYALASAMVRARENKKREV